MLARYSFVKKFIQILVVSYDFLYKPMSEHIAARLTGSQYLVRMHALLQTLYERTCRKPAERAIS